MAAQPNTSNLALFQQSNPSNVLNGAKKGLGNLAGSLFSALFVMVATPISGGIMGYKQYSVGGALLGSMLGALGGVLIGAGILIGGTYSFLRFFLLGLFRTPTAVYSLGEGKEWDKDAEIWLHYSMQAEQDSLLSLTEDQFVERVGEQKTPREIYASVAKEPAEEGARPKKVVVDRVLYDVLGVEPEASSAEIKKAYYSLARKNHPDRNPDDAEAKAKFQLISQSYEVLGDEATRRKYDERGKEAVSQGGSMDAGMLYSMVFGSDQFESIIGELAVATQLKFMMEATKPTSVLRYRQRVRELKVAVILANKLDALGEGEDSERLFREQAAREVEELSQAPMGGTLLGLVGSIYVTRGSAHLSSLSALYLYSSHALDGLGVAMRYLGTGFGLAWSAMEIRSIQQDAKARQQGADKRDGVTEEQRKEREEKAGPMDKDKLFGPEPSAQHKERVLRSTKQLGKNLSNVFWEITRNDIHETLKHVCKKVLHDHSVSEEVRLNRAKGMVLLGEVYVLSRVSEMDGLSDFLERVGKQTGMFDEGEFKDPFKKDKSDEAEDPSSSFFSEALPKEVLLGMVSELDSLSIRELKENISMLGGDPTKCLEKGDLQMHLRELLQERLTMD